MLLVLSSDREGLSLALLDAMGAGVYGLAGDPRMENWSGFTFERGSAAYLGGMIRFRLANPVIRHAARRAANRRIRKHYLWPKVVRILRRFILIEWAGKL
jgi:glycosyltransferase involved in cell wall biosynthesis